MAQFASCASILFTALTLAMPLLPVHGQSWLEQSSADEKSLKAIRQIHSLVKQMIDSKPFQEPMPLAKFLEALEKQLPKNKKVAWRIDDKVFGNKQDKVATEMIRLPPYPKKMAFATALRIAISQINSEIEITFRIDPNGIIITSAQAPQALYTAAYETQDIIAKLGNWNTLGLPPGNTPRTTFSPAQGASRIVQEIVSSIDPKSWQYSATDHGRMDIVNGTRLLVCATADRQEKIVELLQAVRRRVDFSVRLQARLYEVDDAFYAKLKNAKRIDREEAEKQFLAGTLPKNELFELLPKQKMVLAAEDITIDSGKENGFLSHHQIVACLGSPEQYRQGDKNLQIILEGVSFLATVKVSADRRYVWIQLTEKASQLEQILKEKVLADNEGNMASGRDSPRERSDAFAVTGNPGRRDHPRSGPSSPRYASEKE